MKIYTSQIGQFGRELKVANEKVKFDGTGCAEVEEKVGKKILDYSDWYSTERPKLERIKPKEVVFEEKIKEQEAEVLKQEIVKLTKMNDSRKEKNEVLTKEIEDVRKGMEDVSKERDILKSKIKEIEEVYQKKVEELEYKSELSMLELDELKETCKKLGLPEESYLKKKSKKVIIDLILKS